MKNRKYLYRQTSRRKGKKVVSIMEYICALGLVAAAGMSSGKPGGSNGGKSTYVRANKIQEEYERELYHTDREAFDAHVRWQHWKQEGKRKEAKEARESKMSRGEKRERAEAKEAAQKKWDETNEALKAFNEARAKEKEPPGPPDGSKS